jgi:hypothetical protein
MKTIHSQAHPHGHGPGNLARGLGRQVAAVLLAVLVTPAAFHASDAHSEPPPPVKRSAAPGPRG